MVALKPRVHYDTEALAGAKQERRGGIETG